MNVFEDSRVIKTGATRKLNIGGVTKNYDVYAVPLELLFYNDQNDRIATWLSQYSVEDEFNNDREKYNNRIENFIEESNPKALNKTKNNIKAIGQNIPGIILNDGRIIDGNRRFTCLRQLHRENIYDYGYFETIILEGGIANEKQIKILELTIQHGEDGKIDYNPIDKLVGLYRDVVLNELLTIEEYAQSTNIKTKDAKKELRIALLMAEFLEFIGRPNQFYLAREWDINGPLREIDGALQKEKDEDRKEDIMLVMFTNLLIKPNQDMTRYLRTVKNLVADSEFGSDYLENQLENTEKVLDLMNEDDNPDISYNTVRGNQELIYTFANSTELFEEKIKISQVRNKPLTLLEDCEKRIKDIDIHIIYRLDEDEQYEIKEKIKVLQNLLMRMDDEIDV